MSSLALAYRQLEIARPVAVSDCLRAHVIRLSDYRDNGLSPDEMLSAVLGRPEPMSAVLGTHPDYPTGVHPVHGLILESVIARTTTGIAGEPHPLNVERLQYSAAVIGGPIASRHAAAIFGTPEAPSILGGKLPITFGLGRSQSNQPRLLIEGRSVRREHFLLTSLPMGDQRFLNIAALSAKGGSAADMLFGNPKLIHDLYVRTRPFRHGGWQAAFAVQVRNGQPVTIDPEFSVFEVGGIDFDSAAYVLNDPDFLVRYGETDEKIEEIGRGNYAHSVNKKDALSDILNSLSEFLNENPDQWPVVQARVVTLLSSFSSAAKATKPAAKSAPRPKWSDKAARKGRNPVQFVKDEYREELEAGVLSRRMLHQEDLPLYNAYAAWISPKRHPDDDLHLPRRSEVADVDVTALDGLTEDEIVRLQQIASTARSRLARKGRLQS